MVLLTRRVFRQCVFDRNSIYNLLKRSVTLKSVALEKLYTTSALTRVFITRFFNHVFMNIRNCKKEERKRLEIDVKETRNKR